jgi:hypothetical protein
MSPFESQPLDLNGQNSKPVLLMFERTCWRKWPDSPPHGVWSFTESIQSDENTNQTNQRATLTKLTSSQRQTMLKSLTTSLWECKWVSRVIIPQRRGVNQSQDEHEFNHRENTKGQETTDFSSEVHVLTGTLIPVVSTNTWWFSG